MRTAFVNELVQLAESNPKIFLLCGDLGFSVLEVFRDKFPDRFLNVGISEQNMAGLAAGLALDGYQVYIYSIGNFPTMRCLEQIRYDICYHELDVKIVAVGAGYAYGPLGASHHATEDIAVMRALPGLSVYSPADPLEAKSCLKEMSRNAGPAYLRLGKAGEKILHSGPVENLGDFPLLRRGAGTLILATGSIARYALERADVMGAELRTVPVIKPLNRDALAGLAARFGAIVTVEEHQKDGGFGSAVLENLMDLHAEGLITHLPPVYRVGIANHFVGYAGDQEYMIRKNIKWPESIPSGS